MNNLLDYNPDIFTNLLTSLIQEFVTSEEGGLQSIIVHLPVSWEQKEGVIIKGIPYLFTTEDTLEIEISWTDPKTNVLINFMAAKMKAPT